MKKMKPTAAHFREQLFSILELKTGYWNQYPYNLGYVHSDYHVTFDCVNLLKAILNGWTYTKKVGYFQKDLSKTGDCTEAGLINQCTNVSSDFTKLKDVSVLYMNGHIGCYVGTFTRGGKTYNTIECTSNKWGDGVIATWTDSSGRRLHFKDSASQIGTWAKHGRMDKWLTYAKEEKFDYQKAIRIAMKIEKGDYANNPERKQKIIEKYGEKYYNAAQGCINYLHNNY